MSKLERNEILAAIRTHAEQFGRVPGRKAFLQSHDVSRSAFEGTYWPSWSAAVREAGLEPMLPNQRTPDETVFEALALLTRQLGQMPSLAELRYQRRLDPTFPDRSVFERHLGDAANRATALRSWCSSRPEFADVVALIPPTTTSDHEPEARERDGSVYLLKSGRLYKIGKTYSVARRWAEIAGAAPAEVELVHHVKTDDPSGIEAYWHRRFAPKRQGGEWFKLSAAEVRAFKRRKGFM